MTVIRLLYGKKGSNLLNSIGGRRGREVKESNGTEETGSILQGG